MGTMRRRMRLWAFAWFLCQGLTLFALVPRDCCAHHRAIPAPAEAQHTEAQVSTGTPSCPMHADSAAAPSRTVPDHGTEHGPGKPGTVAPGASTDDCVLRGTCDGPPLFTLFSHTGLLPEVHRLVARAATPAPSLIASANVTGRTESPDSRPPRVPSHQL
jgi:hypothetical protein